MKLKAITTICACLLGCCHIAAAQENQTSPAEKKCPAAGQCPATQTANAVQDAAKECTGNCSEKCCQEKDGAEKGSCCDKDQAADPALAEALAKLPRMTYVVGDEKIDCGDCAAKMAEESKTPIHYVVGDKTFDNKEKAFEELVETTEQFVSEFIEPKQCESTGELTIAGQPCGCSHQQAAMAREIKQAVEAVKMTFVVGGKKCECPDEAKTLAKDSDAPMTFVVNGQSTPCELTARLNLARAKYIAAVKAARTVAAKSADGHTAPSTQSPEPETNDGDKDGQ